MTPTGAAVTSNGQQSRNFFRSFVLYTRPLIKAALVRGGTTIERLIKIKFKRKHHARKKPAVQITIVIL